MVFYWTIWLIVGIILVASFVCIILPKIFYKTLSMLLPVRDRAMKRFNLVKGVTFLYEPALDYRKYIKRYQLYRLNNNSNKFFIGEWTRPNKFADYDLIVYNKNNNIIEILNVKEKFSDDKFTHITELPSDTNYISLKINKINEETLNIERKYTPKFYLWLGVFSISLAASVDFLLWLIMAYICNIIDSSALNIKIYSIVLSITGICVMFVTFFGIATFLIIKKGKRLWKI